MRRLPDKMNITDKICVSMYIVLFGTNHSSRGDLFAKTKAFRTWGVHNWQIGKQLRKMNSSGFGFKSFIFTTNVGMRPAEPCTISVAATHQLLTQILLSLMRQVSFDSLFSHMPYKMAACSLMRHIWNRFNFGGLRMLLVTVLLQRTFSNSMTITSRPQNTLFQQYLSSSQTSIISPALIVPFNCSVNCYSSLIITQENHRGTGRHCWVHSGRRQAGHWYLKRTSQQGIPMGKACLGSSHSLDLVSADCNADFSRESISSPGFHNLRFFSMISGPWPLFSSQSPLERLWLPASLVMYILMMISLICVGGVTLLVFWGSCHRDEHLDRRDEVQWDMGYAAVPSAGRSYLCEWLWSWASRCWLFTAIIHRYFPPNGAVSWFAYSKDATSSIGWQVLW